jgi:hypothetical protein
MRFEGGFDDGVGEDRMGGEEVGLGELESTEVTLVT